ncbi:MAG: response regulator [Desulfobacterales bacterium]
MNREKRHIDFGRYPILVAEDDPDDQLLIKEAFAESGLSVELHFVGDGEELVDRLDLYLKNNGTGSHPKPLCILLDLNMPRKDGREALKEIRTIPEFQDLDVIVLTTSDSPQDRMYCSELGVSDFVTKPGSFNELIEFAQKVQSNLSDISSKRKTCR